MKLRFKEDPNEWRKAALLSVIGLAIPSSVLRWQKVLPMNTWLALVAFLALVAVCALLRPSWFRAYYRVSMRLGFHLTRFLGRVVLFVFFLVILTPLGLLLRWSGKDLLQLKRSPRQDGYWHQARPFTEMDRLF